MDYSKNIKKILEPYHLELIKIGGYWSFKKIYEKERIKKISERKRKTLKDLYLYLLTLNLNDFYSKKIILKRKFYYSLICNKCDNELLDYEILESEEFPDVYSENNIIFLDKLKKEKLVKCPYCNNIFKIDDDIINEWTQI